MAFDLNVYAALATDHAFLLPGDAVGVDPTSARDYYANYAFSSYTIPVTLGLAGPAAGTFSASFPDVGTNGLASDDVATDFNLSTTSPGVAVSLDMWVKVSSSVHSDGTVQYYLISKADYLGLFFSYAPDGLGGYDVALETGPNSGGMSYSVGKLAALAAGWHHIGLLYPITTPLTFKLYWDGHPVASSSTPGPGFTDLNDTFFVGGQITTPDHNGVLGNMSLIGMSYGAVQPDSFFLNRYQYIAGTSSGGGNPSTGKRRTAMAKIGEYVGIEINTDDASTAALIVLKDSNNVARTLQTWERLLIDTLGGSVASGITRVDIFDDKNAGGTLTAAELIYSTGANPSAMFDGGEEGYSVTTGNTPKVLASGAGAIRMTGTGRIVNGQTRGAYPNWKPVRNN